ncbi:aminodeoxychorismate synthase component I [Neolewinella sp.]|uniref:aminodeoxychorismate synthase component I n=1 Tax=Neolewinella sp. TaxID=2993543 RepID=UPI003B52A407
MRLQRPASPSFFLLDFELQRPRFFTEQEWLRPGNLAFDFPGRPDPQPETTRVTQLTARTIATQQYREAFALVQRGLQRGDSFLTNLTFPTPIALDADLGTVYRAVEAKYRVLLPDEFVCFSPETFVTIDPEGYIATSPMKGTAADTPADRAALLSDPKEIAEHATIVDLLRNDLSQVARGVRVTDYRYLLATERGGGALVQTSSDIGGQLPRNWRTTLGATLLRLLPAGSVSGAPKWATLQLIRQAEGQDRGYYCGIAGYYDGQRLDTCVLIRYIAHRGGRYFFHSGGGITARSDWEREYQEMNAKIRLPLRATQ